MLILIIKALYFALPAFFANMSPVIFGKLRLFESLNRPIDGGVIFAGQRLFGQNKTWRGLLSGITVGLITAGVQKILYDNGFATSISVFDYDHWLIFGILAGSGAILGDLIKSFFKRRIGIKPGAVWPVFDQLDFIAGFFIFTYGIHYPGWEIVAIVAISTLILHPLSNIIGYKLGWKKVWW
jgi:CDP-2,3-bis-(O-geranylgeranyl)-sn-glycerol synthase